MIKKLLLIILVVVALGGGYAAYQWNKPARSAKDEKGIAVTAVNLFKEYAADEKSANSKYLDKTLEITGVISSLDTNQDGQVAIIMQADDPMNGVMCTMQDKNVAIKSGETVKIKGICSGLVGDVKIRECILDN